jgi:phosphoglycolate phosphatase
MRGILFDKDGTIFDFEKTWLPALRQLALEAAKGDESRAVELLEAGGFDLKTAKFKSGSIIGAGTTADITRLWYPKLHGSAFAAKAERHDRVFTKHAASHSVPIDGVGVALDVLAARGFVMGVATNDTTEGAKASLLAAGVSRNLPHVFGADAVAKPKPAPDMVVAFCMAARLNPSEVIVVGDNTLDLEMARSAGAAMAIGVTSGNSRAEDLSGLADVVLNSIRELPAFLAAAKERHQNRK